MKIIITTVMAIFILVIGLTIDSAIINAIVDDLSQTNEYYSLIFYGSWIVIMMITVPIMVWTFIFTAWLTETILDDI